jgi:hypothetical protein
MPTNKKKIKASLLVLGCSIGYLLLSYFLIGFKSDQLILVGLFNFMYYLSAVTRKFILGFTVFIVFWIIFDYMKAFPNYEYHSVSIKELYELEKSIFGFTFNGAIITPNEYWLAQHTAALDIMSGIFYLSWIPVPLTFAGYIIFLSEKRILLFLFNFFIGQFIGILCLLYLPCSSALVCSAIRI